MRSEALKMSVHLSPELSKKLEKMSEESHSSKSDVLRKAIFLMDVAIDSKKHGNKLAVVDQKGHKVSEIIGV
jgi:predicted transcriptional regulator